MDRISILHLILFLLSLISFSVAEIKDLKITGDYRPILLFEKFGFSPRGFVDITLSDVSVSSSLSSPDPSLFGFFLSDEKLIKAFYASQQEIPNSNPNPDGDASCILSSIYVTRLFNFRELSQSPPYTYNRSFPITQPDEYSLYFANCAAEGQVSMSVLTKMYNVHPDGFRDYLSVGWASVPSIYFCFAVVYAVFLVLWICFSLWKNRLSAHGIHHIMSGLLLAKALNLICAAEDQHYIRVTGTPHGWDVLLYFSQSFKSVLLFTVIILIGTSWSFLKPFLQEREKKVLMIVPPLKVIANIASGFMFFMIGITGPFTHEWILLFVFDIICRCAILLTLRETSRTLAKVTLFWQFYIVFVGYMYFTRIVVDVLRTIAAYKYRWVCVAADEIASFAFYIFIFYAFRPVEGTSALFLMTRMKRQQRWLSVVEFEL